MALAKAELEKKKRASQLENAASKKSAFSNQLIAEKLST
jgi:hypothetical protein